MLARFVHFLHTKLAKRVVVHYEDKFLKNRLGHADSESYFTHPSICPVPGKIFLYGDCTIYAGAKFIMNPHTTKGRFIVKKKAGVADNLTVITNNHPTRPTLGSWYKNESVQHGRDMDEDVVVEEDVWIGENVTLFPGVTIGRGSIVGACSAVRVSIPPYSIVVGNPAKIVGFKLTPVEVIEHEKMLYSEAERLPLEKLEKNYKKYFLDRMKEIRSFTSL